MGSYPALRAGAGETRLNSYPFMAGGAGPCGVRKTAW